MDGPYDYTIKAANPLESFLKGQAFAHENADYKLKQQQQLQALQAQKQMQEDLGAFSARVRSGDATANDYAGIVARYPQLSEHFKRGYDMQSSEQQANNVQQASQVFSALQSGQIDIAKDLLDKQRQAAINAGNKQAAMQAETMYKMIDVSPDTAKATAGMYLTSVLGPKDFAGNFGAIFKTHPEAAKLAAEAQKAQAEAKVTPERLALEQQYKGAEIKNIDSQIEDRANRLGLDKDKLQSETELKIYELNQKAGELPESAKKIVNDSTVAATAAAQASRQSEDLAGRLEKEGMAAGVGAKGAELYKSITGNQDAISALRQEYTRIRAQGVMKSLPPGPASDKDVQMAQKGFPEDTASPSVMASFLRGLAKVQRYEAASKSAEAEWVNAVGHMGKPKTDITIDGITVPKGSTYVDFTRQYLDRRVKQDTTQQGQSQIQSRPYWKYATGAQ